ncbi:serine/threonine-protein kinase-like protein psk1 [Macroventuria anomochaeta]|uniref:Serine/threonine-protein kinase-like protein psk1 n=1 Tax=Macroventuria anomochaeta TaxID=301207 RepID=A0ACB6SJ44_9PLEO|nr:serine/threonine-protein kinase-like protein psk1 [Macroventuria anomochaeta]KAF2633715.1 serine/threonine-protein kinase-like protein psk1 [Macroventuria anomochaeta]
MAIFSFDDDDAQAAKKDAQQGAEPTINADDVFAADKMDMDLSHVPLHVGTPPITIASPLPKRTMQPNLKAKQQGPDKLDFNSVMKNAQKNKKKKKKALDGIAPAANIARGFHTPVTSGGEESDFSAAATPRFGPAVSGLPSVTSSPALRPISSMGGISSLKAQLEALNIGSRTDSPLKCPPAKQVFSGMSSNTSISGLDSTSDSDRTEMESYEVNLDEDFSVDTLSKTSTMLGNNVMRKISADDFEPIKCLGKGSYGTVLLVRQLSTGRLFAQKTFKKASITVHKKLIEQTKTERNILESVNRHPFIVNFYYAFQDHEKLYLILEYAQGGELFHHLEAERMFSEDVAAFYMAEMVLALDHLHRTVGVIYRDLKPENCLLDHEGHLLLTDFGLSKVTLDDESPCRSILGTPEYMAPEVIEGKEYGAAVDWWSLGALGFDLLTGSPPFTGNNNAKIQEKILKQKLALPFYLSADAKDLLTRLLRKDPKKRLGYNMTKDMQTIKNHRFFRKINWKQLQARELEPPIQPLITDPELAENFNQEFTGLPLSPVLTKNFLSEAQSNPFGGFSFVASQSLLDDGDWGY